MQSHARFLSSGSLLLLSILVLPVSVTAGETIIGVGADTCGAWTVDQDNKAQALLDVEWVLGYVAGMSLFANADLFGGLDIAAVSGWMNNYCVLHPLNHIVDGARSLGTELAERHGVKIELQGDDATGK